MEVQSHSSDEFQILKALLSLFWWVTFACLEVEYKLLWGSNVSFRPPLSFFPRRIILIHRGASLFLKTGFGPDVRMPDLRTFPAVPEPFSSSPSSSTLPATSQWLTLPSWSIHSPPTRTRALRPASSFVPVSCLWRGEDGLKQFRRLCRERKIRQPRNTPDKLPSEKKTLWNYRRRQCLWLGS